MQTKQSEAKRSEAKRSKAKWSKAKRNSGLRHWRFFHNGSPLSTINAFFQMYALSLICVKHKSKPYAVNCWAWQSKISKRPQDKNLITAWWLLCKCFKFIFYSYPNDCGCRMESRMRMFHSLGKRRRCIPVHSALTCFAAWFVAGSLLPLHWRKHQRNPTFPAGWAYSGWSSSLLKEQPLEAWSN